MTVSVTDASSGPFYPNGATTTFPFSFRTLSSEEVQFVRYEADGALVVLDPAGYSVVLSSDGEGGSVVYGVAPAASSLPHFVVSNPSFEQDILFEDEGPFNSAVLNPGLDRAAVRDIWLRDRAVRALKVPPGSVAPELPSPAADRVLATTATGVIAWISRALFKGDKGDPGAHVMAVGSWSGFEGLSIPLGTDLVRTADTLVAGSATGTQSALYRVDPEQTDYPALLQSYINTSVAAGTPLLDARASASQFMAFWRRRSANGRWFTLAEHEPWSGMFGTPGDGAQQYAGPVTGTDVWLNMQCFIDYCVYIRRCRGRISPGGHRLARGLQHGYGDTFVGGEFMGAAASYAGATNFAGTTLFCDTDEDPMLNLSGGRNQGWSHVAFRGRYQKHLIETTISYPTSAPGVAPNNDLDPASWLSPLYRNTQDGRYNPACLVALGAYDGTKPVATAMARSTAYAERDVRHTGGNTYHCMKAGTTAGSGGPTGTGTSITDGTCIWRYLGPHDPANPSRYVAYREPYRPAWLLNPALSSYGNVRYSSFSSFTHCAFSGCPVLVVSKPGDNPLQNDFVDFDRCNFNEYNFAFTAGNHQLRNLGIRSCNFGIGNCALTNMIHGSQTGSFKGCVIENTGFGAGVDLFRVNATYGQPMTFIGCYTEGQRRLGQCLGGGRANMGAVFIGCEFAFAFIHPEKGRAPRLLWNQPIGNGQVNEAEATSPPMHFLFQNCKLHVDSVFDAYIPGVRFENTIITASDRAGIVAPYIAHFHNATAGGFIAQGLEYRRTEQKLVFDVLNLDTGDVGVLQASTERGYPYGDRRYGIPACVKSVRAGPAGDYEELVVPHAEPLLLAKSSIAVSFPTSGADRTEMTIVFTGATKANSADLQGFGPGSGAVDGQTGTVFACRSFDDATDTAIFVAQNNYKTVGGVKEFIHPVSTNTGNIVMRHARVYTPAFPIFGDVTAGSATIANVGYRVSDGSQIEGSIAVGDYLVSPTTILPLALPAASVTARANGTISTLGSITLSSNALLTSPARQRLGFFRRPVPANA